MFECVWSRLWHWCFRVNFAKFLRTTFLTENLWWLLLKTDKCVVDTKLLFKKLELSTSKLDWSFYIVSIARKKVRAMICWMKFSSSRSSHPDVFCKEGALGNFAKFTGKHLCQSLFFNKVAGLGPPLKNQTNFQEHLFLWNTSGGCFCSSEVVLAWCTAVMSEVFLINTSVCW